MPRSRSVDQSIPRPKRVEPQKHLRLDSSWTRHDARLGPSFADNANLTDIAAYLQAVRFGGAASPNYQGLWWATGGTESGWGVNFAHQGDKVFATWYTYDTSGNAYWLSMLADRTSATSNAYSGTINSNVGSPFDNYTGNSPAVPVGTGILTFSDADNGTFDYTIASAGGATNVHQVKAITRYLLTGGSRIVCQYSATADPAAATNYQDLWWVPAESGWGSTSHTRAP